jgi:hypothetical protein
MQRLQQDSHELEAECNAVMAEIDWEKTAEAVSGYIPFSPPATSASWLKRWFPALSGFTWKPAAAALMIVFGLGIGMGYLLFGPGENASNNQPSILANNAGANNTGVGNQNTGTVPDAPG